MTGVDVQRKPGARECLHFTGEVLSVVATLPTVSLGSLLYTRVGLGVGTWAIIVDSGSKLHISVSTPTCLSTSQVRPFPPNLNQAANTEK